MGTNPGCRSRFSAARSVATAATWPLGMALTSWHYIWRILPVYRSAGEGSMDFDLPPALPEGVSQAEVQLPRDGFGPLLHRRHACDGRLLHECRGTGTEALGKSGPGRSVAGGALRKARGEPGRMSQGDE